MSEHAELLALGIAAAVEQAPAGPVLFVGPPPSLVAVVAPRLGQRPAVVASPLKPRRLRGLRGTVQVLRASPLQLPAAAGCLAALVAVRQLCRLRSHEPLALAVAHWREALGAGGRLVLADPLGTRPPMLRRRPCPEDLCGVLLNAGFKGIRQSWTRPRRGFVITSGTLAGL